MSGAEEQSSDAAHKFIIYREQFNRYAGANQRELEDVLAMSETNSHVSQD